MRNKVVIFGGGTTNPIANHLELSSKAHGGTARKLFDMFFSTKLKPVAYYSSMCQQKKTSHANEHFNSFTTNEDLKQLVEKVKQDPETKIIVMNAAVCDFIVKGGSSSKPRPDTSKPYTLTLEPADKIVQGIRDSTHKAITLVVFKNTVNATPKEMYLAGLKLGKASSANLVFVNDTVTMRNMIMTPEEATYADGWERNKALQELVDIVSLRTHLTFTRSTVVSGEAIPWKSDLVPNSLRTAVDHCIKNKAYKAFNGATVGHFACKVDDNTFLTSIRRSNFNDLEKIGLVKVTTDGPDEVTAYGFKPSVGGQSQRLIFGQHEGMDCILHFHCPMKEGNPDHIQVQSQREVECGSHECGQNTSNGLRQFGNLKAVYLHNHGPNIVFNRDIDPQEVIDFIERNFDLSDKTGGYNLEERPKEEDPDPSPTKKKTKIERLIELGGYFGEDILENAKGFEMGTDLGTELFMIGGSVGTGKSTFQKDSETDNTDKLPKKENRFY